MRVLYVDDCVPITSMGYGYPRAHLILNMIAAASSHLETIFIDEIGKPADTFLAAINSVRSFRSMHVPSFTALPRMLAECENRFDVIWISRPRNLRALLPYVLSTDRSAIVVYDAEALAASREIGRSIVAGKYEGDQWAKAEIEDEIKLLRSADFIISVNEREGAFIAEHVQRTVCVLGHFHSLTHGITYEHRRGIVFVGGFNTAFTPNLDAITFFLSKVWPLVRKKIDAPFQVVGYRSPVVRRWLRRKNIDLEGVTFNEVEDISSAYRSARLAVIPTRYASGMPWKLTEALSHGVPCVTTKLIAAQLDSLSPPVRSADDPQAMADEICKVYTDRDLWNELSTKSHCYASAHCNIAIGRVRLSHFFNSLFATRARTSELSQ